MNSDINFLKYSNYYDLFYKNKDYEKEAKYILDLCNKINYFPKSILEIGCGTAKHMIYWANQNKEVTGIDKSEVMINYAKNNLKKHVDRTLYGGPWGPMGPQKNKKTSI